MSSRHFIYMVCQHGAEAALKKEVARRFPKFSLAFSRPGFVTFATPDDLVRDRKFQMNLTFARTWGYSLGKVTGSDPQQLAAGVWSLLGQRFPKDILAEFKHLHVWERDPHVPGDFNFEPGISVLADEMGDLLLQTKPDLGQEWQLTLNEDAAVGVRIIDCVIVEPGEWWIGWHRANLTETRWPGGVPEIEVPSDMISRTYLKTSEALKWSEFEITPVDQAIEIGSSPGGSCQALLQLGIEVVGIDPAEMDPLVLEHPNFKHIRGKAKELKRGIFKECTWLIADASVAPNYTLDTVEAIVTHESVSVLGLILTIKLTNWDLADEIPQFNKRVRSWGFDKVRARQLAFNRQEFCIIALRDQSKTLDWKMLEEKFEIRQPTAEENRMLDAMAAARAAGKAVDDEVEELSADDELDEELSLDEFDEDEEESEALPPE